MKKKSEKVKPKAFAQKAKRVTRRPAAAGKKKDSSHAPSLARPTAVRPANPSKNALAKKPAGPARPVKALQTAAAAKTKPAAKATSPKRASAPKRPAKTTAAVKTPKPAKAKKPVQAQTAPTPSSPGRTPESAKKPKSASTPRSAERARPVKTSREKAAETPEPQTQPEASAGVAIPSVDVDAPPAAEPQPEPKRRTAVKTDDDDKALVKFDPLQRYLIGDQPLPAAHPRRGALAGQAGHGGGRQGGRLYAGDRQPAAGRQDRAGVSARLDAEPARPHPGGQHRPDAGREEIRPIQERQVLLLRVVLDQGLHSEVHHGQLAAGEDRHDPGAAQTVLQA
jgi:hypothetical protein